MEKLLFLVSIIFFNKLINCHNNHCFEFSCEECETQEYGTCTKCRNEFRLVDGTCPCSDPKCALCSTGLGGFNLCALCKNGYYIEDNECKCEINDCELCTENNCIMCKIGYAYNEIEKKCEKENESNRIHCFDENCDICYNTESVGCKKCKKGYFNKKGECQKLPSINENNECPAGYYVDNKSKYCQKICDGVSCTIKKKLNYYKCDSNDCLACKNNTLMVYSQCDNSAVCKKEGCLNCITNDECLICTQGYYLLGGICHKCTYGCSICTNNETCISCLSGFELNSSQKCISSKNFDFNINKYKIYKNKLFMIYNVFNRVIDLGNIKLAECDSNCIKCYQNTGKCIECQTHYKLKDNKCIKYCSDSNCLQCPMINGQEECKECRKGCLIEEGKCVCDCILPGCIDCTFENGKKICKKCGANYKLDKGSCKKEINFAFVVFSILSIIILIIVIVFCCICRIGRNERRDIPFIPGRNININMSNDEFNFNRSERRAIRKEVLEEEFEILKRKKEKNQICQFCKKNEGKYICDYGCIVCKEHSNLNENEGDIQNNKVCFVCKRIVKNVTPIEYNCNICFQKKINLAHFKCGCSLKVCKVCYIKCKMMSNKCPGCRAII